MMWTFQSTVSCSLPWRWFLVFLSWELRCFITLLGPHLFWVGGAWENIGVTWRTRHRTWALLFHIFTFSFIVAYLPIISSLSEHWTFFLNSGPLIMIPFFYPYLSYSNTHAVLTVNTISIHILEVSLTRCYVSHSHHRGRHCLVLARFLLCLFCRVLWFPCPQLPG